MEKRETQIEVLSFQGIGFQGLSAASGKTCINANPYENRLLLNFRTNPNLIQITQARMLMTCYLVFECNADLVRC